MDKFSDIKKTHKVVLPKKSEPIIKESVKLKPVEKFFSKLFESREMAHIYHLQTRGEQGSYAKHMALGSYYEEVIELVDDLIEVYMGQYGVVENYDIIDTSITKKLDSVDYFEDLAETIRKDKSISKEDTHLHSIIDDILCLIYKTLYKLKYNK